MAIGIIGLPRSGKSTVFNAATRGHAATANFGSGAAKPNVGVVKVPDPRLDVLAVMEKSKRIVPAEVEYLDFPGVPEGLGKSRGISGEYLNMLQSCDALALVVRAFQDPSVPTEEATIDPGRDVENMEMEMAFSDLALLERREQRIEQGMKRAKATERTELSREMELVRQLRQGLEAETPVREQSPPAEARGLMENFQLLTAKPLLVVFNAGEEDLPRLEEMEAEFAQNHARPGVEVVVLCGKLEMELAQMAPEEEAEFRSSLDAGESGLEKMVKTSYRALDLVSFLTAGEMETRAWSITRGIPAFQAAGKIHSDIQRGFIRAEVVSYDDLVRTGSLAQARREGVLRAEGKQYVMQDGDVVNYLFNV